MFDDRDFAESLKVQYARRRMLTARQLAALKKLVVPYKDQISDFDARAKSIGLDSTPKRKGGRRKEAGTGQ